MGGVIRSLSETNSLRVWINYLDDFYDMRSFVQNDDLSNL